MYMFKIRKVVITINKISVLHTGDLHLGTKVSFFDDDKNKLRQYEIENTCLSVFDDLDGVNICLICGDVFDAPDVSVRYADLFLNKIKSNPGVRFFMTTGNHDYYNSKIISYCVKNCPVNLHIFDSDKIKYVTLDDLNLRIYGASFMQNHHKTSFVDSFDDCDKSYINILCMHAEIFDLNSPFNPTKISDLSSKGFDYVALAHVHNHDKVNKIDNTYYAYSGVCEPRGFDECGEKGYLKGYISKDYNDISFKRIAKRMYISETIDISSCDTLKDIVQMVQDFIISPLNICRFNLIGENRVSPIIDINLLKSLVDAFYIDITDDTSREINFDDFKNDFTLKGICASLGKEFIESNQYDKEVIKKSISVLFDLFDNKEVL